MRKISVSKWIPIFLLPTMLFLSSGHSFAKEVDSASSDTYSTKVKVGYVYSTNFSEGMSDESHKSGYAYEYLQIIAAYTDWEYEYVYGSWSDILSQLQAGQIDLMAGISYTPERENTLLFPDFSMGFENYYIYAYEDQPFVTDRINQLEGIKIGCTKDSMQNYFLEKWNADHNYSCEIITYLGNEELYEAFDSYTIDAVVDTDNAIFPEDHMIPITKVGSSDYYLAINSSKPELLWELNYVLKEININDPYWLEKLHDKYFSQTAIRMTLTDNEKTWIAEHPIIRIGYETNFLAFCGYNFKTKEMSGALKVFLDYANKKYKDWGIQFEAIPYANVGESLDALNRGEVEIVFPIYKCLPQAERLGILATDPLVSTAMTAIINNYDFNEFNDNTVGVAEGFIDIFWYIEENYPNWNVVTYKTFDDCIEALEKNEIQCVVESSYVYRNLKSDLKNPTVTLSKGTDVCFAIKRTNKELFPIMNRIVAADSNENLFAALTQYSNVKTPLSFTDLIRENLIEFICLVSVVVVILLLILIKAILSAIKTSKLNQELKTKQSQLEQALERAYKDALTGLNNRYYINELDLDNKQSPDYDHLSVLILDINSLKQINDTLGHEAGDEAIIGASQIIRDIFKDDYCFRTGGDEFMVISYDDSFEKKIADFQSEIKNWHGSLIPAINIAIGCSSRKEHPQMSYSNLSNLADQKMYENKSAFYRSSGHDRRNRS